MKAQAGISVYDGSPGLVWNPICSSLWHPSAAAAAVGISPWNTRFTETVQGLTAEK